VNEVVDALRTQAWELHILYVAWQADAGVMQSKCTNSEPAATCNVLQLTCHRHAWNAALQVCEPAAQALEPCKVCVLAAQEALTAALKSQEWGAAQLSMVHCPPAVILNFRRLHSRQETSYATGDFDIQQRMLQRLAAPLHSTNAELSAQADLSLP